MLLDHIPGWIICILITLILYGICVSLEVFAAWKRGLKIYDLRNSLANSFILLGFTFITGLWSNLVIIHLYRYLHEFAFWDLFDNWQNNLFAIPLWQFVLLFILDDLTFYVYHRVSHRFKFGWALHETHHSSSVYNMTVAAREPWTAILVSFIFWIPLVLIGFDPQIIILQQWVNLTYQLFIHTPLVGKLGPLEYFLNTPSHHRVHHGVNSQYLDKNLGGILIVWDKIFGTFEPENEQPIYGITPELKSNSPFKIVFNGLTRYSRELRQSAHSRLKKYNVTPQMQQNTIDADSAQPELHKRTV